MEKHPRASQMLLGGQLREALVSATVRLEGACRHFPKFGSLNLQLNLIPVYISVKQIQTSSSIIIYYTSAEYY